MSEQCTSCQHRRAASDGKTEDGHVDTLGGYRLVRRLGSGVHSDVWLGTDGSEVAAIKVFHQNASRDRIDSEIEALGRVSSRHIVRLDDLAMGPDGVPCLILQRLSQWNLGRVLGGGQPRTGEAVTILAPLCLAVAEMHRVGVAHGRIGGASVLFDEAGAPVLACFGHATLFGPMPTDRNRFSLPPAKLLLEETVSADLNGLADVCASVLDVGSEVTQWLQDQSVRVAPTFAAELAERIFSCAVAAPVRFAIAPRGESGTLIPVRLTDHRAGASGATPDQTAQEPVTPKVTAKNPTRAHLSAFLHIPEGMVDAFFEGWITVALRRVGQSLKPVRKPVWVMAGVVLAGVITATSLLPFAGEAKRHTAEATAPSETPAASLSAPGATTRDDDPLTAAAVLLDARTECFNARSVLCLDAVNQQGSAAMEADVTQVRREQEGGTTGGDRFAIADSNDNSAVTRQVSLMETLGDSALLSVTFSDANSHQESFSLLLINGNEGWRIRDLTPAITSPY